MMELTKLSISDNHAQDNTQENNDKENIYGFKHDVFLTPTEVLIAKNLEIKPITTYRENNILTSSQQISQKTNSTIPNNTQKHKTTHIIQKTLMPTHSKKRTIVNNNHSHIPKSTQYSLRQSTTAINSISPAYTKHNETKKSPIKLHINNDVVQFRLDEIKEKLSRISKKINTYVSERFTSIE